MTADSTTEVDVGIAPDIVVVDSMEIGAWNEFQWSVD